INTSDLLAKALRDNVAFVPGAAAYVDGRGTGSMRLNFSGSSEDEIREGIRRIGKVVSEQVALYETLTGEESLPAASSAARPEAPGSREGPAPEATVVPLPPRRKSEASGVEGRGAE